MDHKITKVEFETQRCQIRPFEKKDIEAYMAYRNDANWMRYQGFKCKDRETYKKPCLADIR